MKEWKWFAAVVSMTASLTSQNVHAWHLGEPESRAFLGDALRVTVPLTLSHESEKDDDGCPHAVVIYGDQPVDAGKVILRVSPPSDAQRTLTIRAIQPINEPLIEVKVTYGCTQPITRQFMVFANPPEFSSDMVVIPASVSTAEVPPAPVSVPSRRSGAVALADAMNGVTTVRDHSPRAVMTVQRQPAPAAPRAPAGATAAATVKPAAPESEAPLPEPQVVQAVAAPKPDASADASSPAVASATQGPSRKPSMVLKSAPPPAPSTPKLVLDPVVPMAMGLPGSDASGDAAYRATFLALSAQQEVIRMQAQLIADRQRLDEMEKLVTNLRDKAANASSGGMSATIPITDIRHPAWLMGVSSAALLFAGLSLYLMWRLHRQSRSRVWWDERAPR